MSTGDFPSDYYKLSADSATITTASGSLYDAGYDASPYYEWKDISGSVSCVINNNKKGDDDMRYLYEVILVNPKDDEFYIDRVVARSETSALMEIYKDSPFNEMKDKVPFDDLKVSCHILFEWKKKESLIEDPRKSIKNY